MRSDEGGGEGGFAFSSLTVRGQELGEDGGHGLACCHCWSGGVGRGSGGAAPGWGSGESVGSGRVGRVLPVMPEYGVSWLGLPVSCGRTEAVAAGVGRGKVHGLL
jgi:hypothetical protein